MTLIFLHVENIPVKMNQKAAQSQVDSLCYHNVGKPSCFLWHSVLYVTRVYDTLEPFKTWISEVQDLCVTTTWEGLEALCTFVIKEIYLDDHKKC